MNEVGAPLAVARRTSLMPSAASPSARFAGLVLGLLLAGCLLLSLAMNALSVIARVDVAEPESAVVVVAQHFSSSGHLYGSLQEPPYTPVAYGPVLYLVLAGLAHLFHLQFLSLLRIGRLLTLVSFFVLAAATYVIARRTGNRRLHAVVPALFLLTSPAFARWSATVRPDVICISFSVLCVMLALSPSRKLWLALAGVCGAIAIMIKLTYVAATGAVFLYLIWRRRYTAAMVFVSSILGTVLVIGLIFILRHEPILSQLLIMRHVTWSGALWRELALQQWRQEWTKLLLAAWLAGLWYAWNKGEARRGGAALLGLYSVFAWLIALVTTLNSGANPNYYLEPQVACALLLPFAVAAVAESWYQINSGFRILVAAMVILVFARLPFDWLASIHTLRKQIAATRPVARAVAGTRVLSSESYLGALSSEPEMLDPYLMTQLKMHGLWENTPIVRKISAGQYDYVVVRILPGMGPQLDQPSHGYGQFDDMIIGAIRDSYSVLCYNSEYLVLVPARAASQRPSPPGHVEVCGPGPQAISDKP